MLSNYRKCMGISIIIIIIVIIIIIIIIIIIEQIISKLL